MVFLLCMYFFCFMQGRIFYYIENNVIKRLYNLARDRKKNWIKREILCSYMENITISNMSVLLKNICMCYLFNETLDIIFVIHDKMIVESILSKYLSDVVKTLAVRNSV